MKNILITGGAGFIGSNLARHLIMKGHNICIVDNFSSSGQSCTTTLYEFLGVPKEYTNNRVDIVGHDISNAHNTWPVEHHFEWADIVYHLASSVGVNMIDKNPRIALRNIQNINNTILPLLCRYKNKLIFASTSEVYGDTDEAKESDTLKIGPPTKLRWGYACNKLAAEFAIKTLEIDSVIVRFFNVTGVYQTKKSGMVLPSLIHNALRNIDMEIYGSGDQTRSFCDIRDACVMLEHLIDDKHNGEIYNIGNPNNLITVNDLALKVKKLTSSESKIIHKPYNQKFSEHFGEIYKRKPNIDKISRYYKPIYSMEDTILHMKENDKCI